MSTKVGTVALSYDVDRLHTQVKDALLDMGYYKNWYYGDGPNYPMPNTTVWKSSHTTDSAISDIRAVCQNLGVTLDKAVAVIASDFVGV